MQGKYVFWLIFAMGGIISFISGIAMFLPAANQELNEAIFFFVAPILAFMLYGRQVVKSNYDFTLPWWRVCPLILMFIWMLRSFYRLMFLLF